MINLKNKINNINFKMIRSLKFLYGKYNKLLKIIRCPITKQELEYDRVSSSLIVPKGGLKYEVFNGIPMFTHKSVSIVD